MKKDSFNRELSADPEQALSTRRLIQDRPLKREANSTHSPSGFPDRYFLEERNGESCLVCAEAPQIQVIVQRHLSFSEAEVRKASPGTIFLDGVAQGPPLLDLEKAVFNLDHHQGCVRAFTLATCEQALILVLRGLDLKERPWVIYANDPDLDTVLAIWVLLNHIHLSGDRETVIHKTILPLIRLEGVIDSHGLELKEFTALGRPVLQEAETRLEQLLQQEKSLKREGKWAEVDPLPYTLKVLQALDRMVFPADFFRDFHRIDELARVELAENRLALVCRSDRGIFEIESELKRLYGRRLGLVLLQKTPNTYTARQVGQFSPFELERVYHKLNVLDPAVSRKDTSNRWGGSDEIGGSPRKTGTRLSPYEIADACRLALGRPGPLQHAGWAALALLLSAAPLLAGWFSAFLQVPHGPVSTRLPALEAEVFLGGTLAVTALLLALLARGRRHLFGLQWPAGWDWILLLPLALFSSLAGGAWYPWLYGAAGWNRFGWGEPTTILLISAGFPLTAELLFRGLAHGFLVRDYSIQGVRGSWFLSWPAFFTALLYAGWTAAAQRTFLSPLEVWWPDWVFYGRFLAALLFGLVAGLVRERSGSVLVPLIFHLLCAASVGAILRWIQ